MHNLQDFNQILAAPRNLEDGSWDPDILKTEEMASYITSGGFRLVCPHGDFTDALYSNLGQKIDCNCFGSIYNFDLVDKLFSYTISGIQNCDCYVGGICDATPVQINQILTEASLAFAKQKRIYLLLPSTNQSLQEIQQKYPHAMTSLLTLSYQSLPLLSYELDTSWGKRVQSDFWFIPMLRERYGKFTNYQETITQLMGIDGCLNNLTHQDKYEQEDIAPPQTPPPPPTSPTVLQNEPHWSVPTSLQEPDIDPSLISLNIPRHTPHVPDPSTHMERERDTVTNIGTNPPHQLVRRIMRQLATPNETRLHRPRQTIDNLVERRLLSYREVAGTRYLIDSSNTLYCTMTYRVAGVYNPVTDSVL
jgi:hypothetical protein